ncbi:uncharacterized protein LOC132201760 [Neocloeon triangulifer]|uniref:uncharacterized protein LOC132201760 n=1 Tax=Neocloeon triangulifer TaxID=2078957 RepID=UPI00286EDEFF|nr:uncharacterized protein LOC132201760 [Neocloeon triangulifer]
MVLPQYTFAALALGAIAAIAVTLYATFNGTAPNRYRQRDRSSGNGSNTSSRHRQRKCEVCQKRGEMLTLPCTHTYHKACLMNLHGDDMAPECPEVCVVCWEPIKKEDRAEIENKRSEECSICLDDIIKKSLVLECGHEFHIICAKRLIQFPDRKCPNCRIPLSAPDLRNIVTSS